MRLRGTVSYAQAQGPREHQEDFQLYVPFTNKITGPCHLLATMDGHGGEEVARYCAETIPGIFDQKNPNIKQELGKVVEQLVARTTFAEPGTTLSLAHISERKHIATTAILGDSPIVIVDRKNRVCVGEEHNVRTNTREREAAIGRGATYQDGFIFNESGEDGLQMSRALGDRSLGGILDRTPTISEHILGWHSIVIVGSDGIFDPGHENANTETLEQILNLVKTGKNAEEILHWREKQTLMDNTSLIVWKALPWWSWFK